jgi:hypothetical protein
LLSLTGQFLDIAVYQLDAIESRYEQLPWLPTQVEMPTLLYLLGTEHLDIIAHAENPTAAQV